MKLMSMTDFVLKQNYTTTLDISQIDFYDKELSILEKIRNYANFLKQPLKLEMFIPCDEDGNVLEEPKIEDYFDDGFNFEFNQKHFKDVVLKEYYKAKSKVLFEGFELDKNLYLVYRNEIAIGKFISYENESKFLFREYFKTIEDLHDFEFPFTENAIKQIGL